MNHAAIELLETGIDWANAALSRIAKNHGGAHELVADIYENGYLDGYHDALKGEKMKQLGIIGLGMAATAGVGAIAIHYFKKSKDKERELEKKLAETSRLKADLYAKDLLSQETDCPDKGSPDNIIVVDFKKSPFLVKEA